MRRKSRERKSRREKRMKGSLASHLTVHHHHHQQQQLGQVSFMPLHQKSSSIFQVRLESGSQEANLHLPSSSLLDVNIDSNGDDKDFILSQDFFCTPDYITPDCQYISNSLDCNNKENIPCPKSPEKLITVKSKRQRLGNTNAVHVMDGFYSSNIPCHEQVVELAKDSFGRDELKIEKSLGIESQKSHSYVSQSAVALRCRVMPPPCLKNPYMKNASDIDIDPFSNQRSKCAGYSAAITGGDGLSRYRTDFHEIEQIGNGNFSCVFKALKRIDGCLYAVKKSTRPLTQDSERRKALMEVQALAALGYNDHLVGYNTSWFENDQLFIQMELCDHSLSISRSSKLCTEVEVLEALHQIARALQFIHERGIAHLDVKPDNIYVKDGVYKLGDFGCATVLDKGLPIEEGDARYMPQEILNDNYDHLDKVDIFSLGAAMYELVRGSALPVSGPLSFNLREGKLPLLPGHSVQFQNLLKAMIDPDPVRRPSAKELVELPIFDKGKRSTTK